jgi:hypothetical protein
VFILLSIRFALIAHSNVTDFKAKKRGKKVGSKCVVLCPFAGDTLLLSKRAYLLSMG